MHFLGMNSSFNAESNQKLPSTALLPALPQLFLCVLHMTVCLEYQQMCLSMLGFIGLWGKSHKLGGVSSF